MENEKTNPEDLIGGFHNVQPPEDWVEPQDEVNEQHGEISFITEGDGDTVCYRGDSIAVQISPEKLYILISFMKRAAENGLTIDYLEQGDAQDRYDQQGTIRELVSELDETLDEYVRVRTHEPFLANFVGRIGKKDVRRMSAGS